METVAGPPCQGFVIDGWYCGKKGSSNPEDVHYAGFGANCVKCVDGWRERGWFCGCEWENETQRADQLQFRQNQVPSSMDGVGNSTPGNLKVDWYEPRNCKGWKIDGWYCGTQGSPSVHYGGFEWECIQCGLGWQKHGWFCGCKWDCEGQRLEQEQTRLTHKLPSIHADHMSSRRSFVSSSSTDSNPSYSHSGSKKHSSSERCIVC